MNYQLALKLLSIICNPKYLKALIRHSVAAGAEHEPVLRLSSFKVVIDIGANRGQFALAVRASIPNSYVISFEPLPTPAAIFQRVFSDDDHVILHEAAIGACIETRTMHISHRDDSSSFLPISSVQTALFPGTEEVARAKVHVAPLDKFISADDLHEPAMLKLDVQGFEYEALVGCESLLSYFQAIYCECSFVELYSGQKLASNIIDWLHARDFALIGIYNTSYDRRGRPVQADLLFARKK